MSSGAVSDALNSDKMIDYQHYVQQLFNRSHPTLIYAGEFDAQDGPKTIYPWLCDLIEDDLCGTKQKKIYWVANASDTSETPQLINGGLYIEAQKDPAPTNKNSGAVTAPDTYLTFLTVPKAGHFVPNNYYSVTQQFIKDYASSMSLQEHGDAASGTGSSVED